MPQPYPVTKEVHVKVPVHVPAPYPVEKKVSFIYLFVYPHLKDGISI